MIYKEETSEFPENSEVSFNLINVSGISLGKMKATVLKGFSRIETRLYKKTLSTAIPNWRTIYT